MPVIQESSGVASSSRLVDQQKAGNRIFHAKSRSIKAGSGAGGHGHGGPIASSYMRLEEPNTPTLQQAHLLSSSPYLHSQARKASASPGEGGAVEANANFATLPLSVNQKLNVLNNVNSRQATRISAMSNAYSSRSRPNSLKSAIDGVNSRKAL